MGLFHKTLKDAIRKLEKGDREGAVQIIQQHLNRDILSNEKYGLQRLVKALQNYQGYVSDALQSARDPQKVAGAIQQLSMAENELMAAERRMQRMLQLMEKEE